MKILAIGNSFSQDATAYLHDFAKSAGYSLKVVNLYIGGCSLSTHWQNAVENAPLYQYEENGNSCEKYVSINEALEMDDWDIVTLQQVSTQSGYYETYIPYLKNLSEFVRERAKNAEQVIHQTWAYEAVSDRFLDEAFFNNPGEMFEALKSAYKQAAKDLGNVRIIPSGEAFQNAASAGYDGLYRDGHHASIPLGRYLLSAVWFEALTGIDSTLATLSPGLDEETARALREIAHRTVMEYR